MMVKDEWVQAAITDDNVVVELLVRLKQAQVAPPVFNSALPAFRWGIRQRRSKRMLLRCDGNRDGGSPTTPLCWSGGSSDASPSAVDGFEEISTHGSACSGTNRTSSKRSRRKKTLAELEEEEEEEEEDGSCKEHQTTNENLKRTRLHSNSSLIDNEPEMVHCPRPPDGDRKPPLDSRNAGKDIFVLPDLNMMPGEDDSGPEMLHGTS
ncbi:hypothetical protein F3Y22_tig00110540pilonHSYRG00050 [Hibiscus syriacus]|uniref:Uncharacterized protein n=1 Tax=Hibiscus syriacus TaxID=106335 RepID=A0A6A3AAN8_HIBSY|nr:hypothetical protein F3Y22_tig00110540pilonHSYRG00050 [Hibiscus syriacus]